MRGKLRFIHLLHSIIGITPACAGKTFCTCCLIIKYRDHPRVCGENKLELVVAELGEGSPPRVRGKLRCRCRFLAHLGITPACAGKTKRRMGPVGSEGDHPRVCGENEDNYKGFNYRLGSPPRVRGKPRLTAVAISPTGITPACAGKTESWKKNIDSVRDHPRVCGENL